MSLPYAKIDVPPEAAALIPDADLAGDGREGHPHVTVKFGVREDPGALRAAAAPFLPMTVTLGRVKVFPPSKPSGGAAPVVVEAWAEGLAGLHDAVDKAVGARADDFPYAPHVTLAYVKGEAADKYAGDDSLAGIAFRLDAVVLAGGPPTALTAAAPWGPAPGRFPNLVSRNFIRTYILGAHQGEFVDWWRINDHEQWELVEKDVADLRDEVEPLLSTEPWNRADRTTCQEYAAMAGEFPPIVLDYQGEVVDGQHRAAAAMLRGDATIMAYEPMPAPLPRPKQGGTEARTTVGGLDLSGVVADVLRVFPEATGIEAGGSLARGELDSKPGKKSDIDILIRLPRESALHGGMRSDELFKKWRGGLGGRQLDFITTWPGGNRVGQHLYRWEQGLPTPAALLWGEAYDEAADREGYLGKLREHGLLDDDAAGGTGPKPWSPAWPKKAAAAVSGEEVLAYMMRLNKWDKATALGVLGLDEYGSDFTLRDFPLSKLEAGDDYNPALAKKYAELGTPIPPIVLGYDTDWSTFPRGRRLAIRDGNHRVAAGKIRGDGTIKAYVPVRTTARKGAARVTWWRADTGYRHSRSTTAADVIRDEQESGNYPDFPEAKLKELESYPATALTWVTKSRQEAARYGKPEKYPIGDPEVVVTDPDGGYLVLDRSLGRNKTAAADEATFPAGTRFYRGVGEDEVHAPSVAADGCLWLTQSRTFARTYIPAAGLELMTGLRSLCRPPDARSGLAGIQKQLGYEYTDVDYKGGTRAMSWKAPKALERIRGPYPKREDYPDAEAWYKATADWQTEGDRKFRDWVRQRLAEFGYEPSRDDAYDPYYRLKVEMAGGQDRLLPNKFQEGTLLAFESTAPLRVYDMTYGGRAEGDLMEPDYNEIGLFRKFEAAGYDGVQINDFAQAEGHGNVGHRSVGLFRGALGKVKEVARETTTHPEDLWGDAEKHGSKAAAATAPELPAVPGQPPPGGPPEKPEPERPALTQAEAQRMVDEAADRVGQPSPARPADTPEFRRWFGGSKAVGKDGGPLVVYHGTTHDFAKFDLKGGNPENHYGRGFYFTDSKKDAAANYATTEGPDITARVEHVAESIMDELQEEYRRENGEDCPYASADYETLWTKAKERARTGVAGTNLGTTMPVYLSIRRPVVVQKRGGTSFRVDYDEDTGAEKGTGAKLLEAARRVAYGRGMDGGRVVGLVVDALGDPSDFTAWEFEKGIRGSDEIEDEEGNMDPGGFVAEVYRACGFDGVVMDAWSEFGGGSPYRAMEMDPGTKHYVVWNPRQIKSAIGNRGTFSRRSPYITAALEAPDDMFIITVWPVEFDGSPQGYRPKYPPLERYAKSCPRGVPDLRKEVAAAAARWAGKEDAIVTSGFFMNYGPGQEPKVRGLRQYWEQAPTTTRKGGATGPAVPGMKQYLDTAAGATGPKTARHYGGEGDDRDRAFDELGYAQRGDPEEAMLKVQWAAPGVLSFAVEHAGDLTHRMSEHFSWFKGQYGNVKDKVDKVLRTLTNEYGFEKEMHENFRGNWRARQGEGGDGAKYGATYEEYVANVRKLCKGYADAHRALAVYNRPQRLARNAAVALGMWDFATCVSNLRMLQNVLKKGPENWEREAGEFEAGKTAGAAEPAARTLLELKERIRRTLSRSEGDLDDWGVLDDLPVTGDGALVIWRAVEVPAGEAPDPDSFGIYWAYDKASAHPYGGPGRGDVVTVRAELGPDGVDWESVWESIKALHANGEAEVCLDPGDKVRITDVFVNGTRQARSPLVGKTVTASSADDLGLARRVLAEMAPLLKAGLPAPELRVVNSPRAGWLGRDTWQVTYDKRTRETGCGESTVIEVQKSICGNEETLRRVVAHELCHHEDNLVNERPELMRLGYMAYMMLRRGDTGHGAGWKAAAARFNARYGAGFVTEKSDVSYAQEQLGLRPYHILLSRYYDGRLSYEVASRLTAKARKYLERRAAETGGYECRLTTTTDHDFIHGGQFGAYRSSRPKEPGAQAKLEELWAKAEPLKAGAPKQASGSKAAMAENIIKGVDPETEMVFFHSGTADQDKSINDNWLQHQVGDWVIECLNGATDDPELIEQIKKEHRGLVYFDTLPRWVKTKVMVKLHTTDPRIGSFDDITEDLIREHGQLTIVVVKKKPEGFGDAKVQRYVGEEDGGPSYEDLTGNRERAHDPHFGLEPGDYFSEEDVEPAITLTGDDLVQFLKHNYPAALTGHMERMAAARKTAGAFEQWFAGSKVVDGEGRPLRVHHATTKDFDRFSPEGRGGKVNATATDRLGYWFADDAREASGYVGDGWNGKKREFQPGANVMPCYLSVRNPYEMGRKEFHKWLNKVTMAGAAEAEEYAEELRARGHDGIHVTGGIDPRTNYWVAFEPGQIKSATGNRGTWDPADPRVTAGAKSAAAADPDFGPTLDHPAVMYHNSPPENRESILREGLRHSYSEAAGAAEDAGDDPAMGRGIFLDTVPSRSGNIDTWRVDVSGLELERDDTTDISGTPEYDGHEWWVTYGDDIPPSRLKLMTGGAKTADVPEGFEGPERPVSKEYDAVRWIYQQFLDAGLERMPFKNFKHQFEKFYAKYTDLFTKIRAHGRPEITLEDLKKWLDEYAGEDAYGVSYTTYQGEMTLRAEVEELVLQINHGASAKAVIDANPPLRGWLDIVAQGAQASGHPAAGEDTVGWVRLDFVDKDWLLVDEIQTDLIDGVDQAKMIIAAGSFDEFMAGITNDRVRQAVVDRGITARHFDQMKRYFLDQGYDAGALDRVRQQIADITKGWAEHAVATVIDIARKDGIRNVAIHTGATVAGRDPHMGGPKVTIYYDNVAKAFGFKKQRLDVGDVRGEFWVRTAAAGKKPYPARAVERMANRWLKANARQVAASLEEQAAWEVGFTIYRDESGSVAATELARGGAAEVDLPDPPRGCVALGSLHTHVGSEGALSEFDYEAGQAEADRLGSPYYMFVVGPADDGEGLMMSSELFEPTGAGGKTAVARTPAVHILWARVGGDVLTTDEERWHEQWFEKLGLGRAKRDRLIYGDATIDRRGRRVIFRIAENPDEPFTPEDVVRAAVSRYGLGGMEVRDEGMDDRWGQAVKQEHVYAAEKGPKPSSDKPLVERPADYAAARSDPRQVSLYGPGHERELREIYEKEPLKWAAKTARKGDPTSLAFTAGEEGFPGAVVVRWEPGMRWRQVLKAVKAVAGDVAGRSVRWRRPGRLGAPGEPNISIFESPWATWDEQEREWPEWAGRGRQVMYDVRADGSLESVGRAHARPAVAAGAQPPGDEPCPDCGQPMGRHRHLGSAGTFTAEFVCRHIEGSRAVTNPDVHRRKVMRWPAWTLRRISIMSLKPEDLAEARRLAAAEGDRETCERYAGTPGDFPPVVADPRGHLIDGYHRVGAAMLRGDESVMAYVPAPAPARHQAAEKVWHHCDFDGTGGRLLSQSDWVCPCGNTPGQDGFRPCDADGDEVPYDSPRWKKKLQICRRCGRIVDGKTEEVVGRRAGDLFGKRADKVKGTEGDWECLCGNDAYADGFFPCDRDGSIVEPTKSEWKRALWRCGRCGRIIGKDLEVVGHAQEGLFDMRGSHKETPLSDTTFRDPEQGMETNAYADMPEKVRGVEALPALEELAPGMFKEGAAGGGRLEDVRVSLDIVDSRRGELFGKVTAEAGGAEIGYVMFSEAGNPYAPGLEDGDEVPSEVWIKYVHVDPAWRRLGVATAMYEKIKEEFPGERITSSGTTGEGGKFRSRLLQRGVISSRAVAWKEVAEHIDRHNPHEGARDAWGSMPSLGAWEWTEETIQPDDPRIDLRPESPNQLHPASRRDVKRYMKAYKGGSEFPAIVVALKPAHGGKLSVWDGAHRLQAAINLGVPIKAYVGRHRGKAAAYAEAQNEVRHTDHGAVGMTKVLKGQPFAAEIEEMEANKAASFDVTAADYGQMFARVLAVAPQWKPRVDDEVAWARKTLRKQDRIVWWLRWYRLALWADATDRLGRAAEEETSLNVLHQELGGSPPQTAASPKTERYEAAKAAFDAEFASMRARCGHPATGAWLLPETFTRSRERFQHFMSLPVAKIQDTVWDKQTPEGLGRAFAAYEKEWQDQVKGLVRPQEGDEALIRFPDGWAWWKLDRAYCPEEARAMGHCGNVVGQDRPDERILSLRRPVKVGREDWWEPHCTFILEPSGLLGEMKGKANAKPAAAYHKYIVPLLEGDAVKGIQGGGYLPSHNFSLADLPKEEQERLVNAKPALANCEFQYHKEGTTPQLVERVSGALGWDLSHSTELDGFVLNEYKSLDEFVQDAGNPTAKWINKVMTGDEDLDFWDSADWAEALGWLDAKHLAMVEKFIRVEHADKLKEWEEENDKEFDGSEHDIQRITEDMDLDEVKEALDRGSEAAWRWGTEHEMVTALVSAIDNMEQDAPGGEKLMYETHTDKEGKDHPVWDAPVTSYYPMEAACKLADSGRTFDDITDDWQYGQERLGIDVKEPYNGWNDWDKQGLWDVVEEEFGRVQTPAEKAKAWRDAKREAKRRPDLILSGGPGKIHWCHNPSYKGPKLGPGGVELDEQGNPVKKKRRRKSGLLEKRAWEGEMFRYFGLSFDVEEAERIIEAAPRPAHAAPRAFLESFVGAEPAQGATGATGGDGSIDLLSVGLNRKHVDEVDETKPGIVATMVFKPDKRHPEPSANHILIDGNHRAKKRLRMGLDSMEVHVLTPEETWRVVSGHTPPALLRGYVNPTAKPRKRKSGLLERKEAAEPWEQGEHEYSGRWSPEETEEQGRERVGRSREWQQAALAALSTGRLSPEEGERLGVYEARKFRPLPGTLWHVTTAKSTVLSEGLKSRHELGQGLGRGLGGGDDKSISFTTDPDVAKGIYENLLIARRVAAGEMTLEDLIGTAERGDGADRPWLREILEAYYHGDEKFQGYMLDALRRGVVQEHVVFGGPPEEGWRESRGPKPGNWRPTPWSYHWTGGDGKERHTYWERDMTPEEKREAVFGFFKKWSFFREHAGGGLDPLYFMSDPHGLARTPEHEIALLRFSPAPGAMGTQESGLGEWRTYSGAAVRLEGQES